MATLGGINIEVVYSDKGNSSVNVTSHPVERGIDVTDHVSPNADVFNISGFITGANASSRRQQIIKLMKDGTVITYLHRLALSNVVIVDFDSTHDVTNKGGFKFTATLQEVRFAQVPIIKENPTLTGTLSNVGLIQPVGTTPTKIYTPKAGDTLQSVATKEKVNVDKLYEKNRHVLSSKLVRLTPTNKLVIPLQ